MPPTVVETIESGLRRTPCNETSLGVDTRLVARLRRPPGGYELVRGFFGRGVFVKHRKADWRIIGFAMVAVGVVIVAWVSIEAPDPMGLGRVLIIVGSLVAVFAKLNTRSTRSTEDYKEGYDKGKDDGYKMAQEEGGVVKPERPVLVDLADHIERNRADN